MTDDDELDRLSSQLDRIAARMRAEGIAPALVAATRALAEFNEAAADAMRAWQQASDARDAAVKEMHATVTASQRSASVPGDPKLTAFLERNAQEVAAWPARKQDAQRNTKSLREVFDEAAAEVAAWPAWKQEILRRARAAEAYARNEHGGCGHAPCVHEPSDD